MASPLDITSLFSVRGLVAVITGGGTGIGLMIARALDANGAEAVYIIGRRQTTLQSAVSQAVNGKIIPIVGDVTSKESLASIASHVRAKQGYVDVVFANSGVGAVNGSKRLPQDRTASAKEFADAHWEDSIEDFTSVMNVNVSGVFYTAMAFLELLDQGNKRVARPQKGSIIVTTSVAAFARQHVAGIGYNVSKAAATHLVKMLATRLVDYNVRVNAIAPGLYPSEMSADLPFMRGDPTSDESVPKSIIPLERGGRETDMAGAALFLASPAGAYVTGTVLVTDGGRLGIVANSY